MNDLDRERLSSYRSEAASFFAANQAQRTAAERVVALTLSVLAIVVAAGINANTLDVVLPLPALALLLLSYMLNQYSDLTVLGVARQRLEDQANSLLGVQAHIYETAVAGVRKVPPLSYSVRLLQVTFGLLIVAVCVVGTYVAFDDQHWFVLVGYVLSLVAGVACAASAYFAMSATPRVAAARIASVLFVEPLGDD